MTIKELKELLNQYPEDTKVIACDNDLGYIDIHRVERLRAKQQEFWPHDYAENINGEDLIVIS